MISLFHEVRFPLDIGAGSNFGPSYSTDVVTMPNGAEQRNVNWSYPRCSGSISMGVKEEADFQRLLIFFHNRCGKAYGFRFFDYMDHAGVFEYLGTSDGSTRSYQLNKNYVDEILNLAKTRKIIKPVYGSVRVFLMQLTEVEAENFNWSKQIEFRNNLSKSIPEGVEQMLNWYIDTTTGIITFVNAPPANMAILASFDFDVPVRFDSDSMVANWELVKAAGWTDIPLIELKF